MDMGRFVIEMHLLTGRPVKELANEHGVSAGWAFKLLRRYRLEGEAGLEARSRRPKTSPTRIADLYEDQIVAMRKELADFGVDAGAETIRYHLLERRKSAPSVSTIWRVLRARGFVTPQPQKRPKSSYVRFVADLPMSSSTTARSSRCSTLSTTTRGCAWRLGPWCGLRHLM
jgi:transposase